MTPQLHPESAPREDTGRGTADCHGAGGLDCGCAQLQERPTTGRMAGARPTAALQRWQGDTARHQQARRRVSANLADTRRPGRTVGRETPRKVESLARQVA